MKCTVRITAANSWLWWAYAVSNALTPDCTVCTNVIHCVSVCSSAVECEQSAGQWQQASQPASCLLPAAHRFTPSRIIARKQQVTVRLSAYCVLVLPSSCMVCMAGPATHNLSAASRGVTVGITSHAAAAAATAAAAPVGLVTTRRTATLARSMGFNAAATHTRSAYSAVQRILAQHHSSMHLRCPAVRTQPPACDGIQSPLRAAD